MTPPRGLRAWSVPPLRSVHDADCGPVGETFSWCDANAPVIAAGLNPPADLGIVRDAESATSRTWTPEACRCPVMPRERENLGHYVLAGYVTVRQLCIEGLVVLLRLIAR